MASPTVRAFGTPNNGTDAAPAFTVNAPAGVTAGDLLLAFAANDTTGTAWTASPGNGWVKLSDEVQGATHRLAVYALIADGSDGLSIAAANNNDYSVVMVAITVGTHGVADVNTDIVIPAAATAATGNADPPASGTVASQDWRAFVACAVDMTNAGDAISAAPTNYTTGAVLTKSASSTSSVGLGVGHRALTAATSEDPGTFTNTSRPWVAKTILIPPLLPNDGAATGAVDWVGSATGTTVRSAAATGSVAWVGSATGEMPTVAPNEGSASGAITWAGVGADGYMDFITTSARGVLADESGLDLSVDGEWRFDIALDDWTPAALVYIMDRWVTGTNDRCWRFQINTAGDIVLNTGNSTGTASTLSTVLNWNTSGTPANGARKQLRFTVDGDDGSGNTDATFYSRDGTEGLDLADNTGWVQEDTGTAAAVQAYLANSAAPVVIHSQSGGTVQNGFVGRFYRGVLWSDLSQTTKVLDVDFTVDNRVGGDETVWNDPARTGNWSIVGGADADWIPDVGGATGTTTRSGAATGSIAWAGAATGAAGLQGSATGSITWAGTADGEAPAPPPNEGAATGSITWAGTADGTTTRQGASTGSISWAGSATGTTTRAGAGTGSVTWSGTADGSTVYAGSATGAVLWAGTATGTTTRQAAATGSITWAGTADGEAPAEGVQEGSADGSIIWAGSATGTADHEGSATGSIVWNGSATGAIDHAGAATGAITWTGSATGIQPSDTFWTPNPVAYTRDAVAYTPDPSGYVPF